MTIVTFEPWQAQRWVSYNEIIIRDAEEAIIAVIPFQKHYLDEPTKARLRRNAQLIAKVPAVRAYAAALLAEIDAMAGESSVITDLRAGAVLRRLRQLVK